MGNVCKMMTINEQIGKKDRKYKLMIKSGMYWGGRQTLTCKCTQVYLLTHTVDWLKYEVYMWG